jgi:Tol biopolymer transport system component
MAALIAVSACTQALPCRADAGTVRLSVSTAGVEGNHNSNQPCISADGRIAAFVSSSQSLAPSKTTTVDDIFARDNETGILTRITIGLNGAEPNGASSSPSISADGRYIVFESQAKNLVLSGAVGVYLADRTTGQISFLVSGQTPVISRDGNFVAFASSASNLVVGDTNNATDVFVLNRATGAIDRASVSSSGVQGDNVSGIDGLAISADGRYVAFQSKATNLVPGDTNTREDVFVHDRQTGQTTRDSVASDGSQGNAASSGASISADGRIVIFSSQASNLVPADANNAVDVFARDRQSGQTTRIAVSTAGIPASAKSGAGVVSPSGRFVVFESADAALVAGDGNGASDVFLRDLQASTTARVSLTNAGGEAAGASDQGAISDDGRYLVFRSAAANIVDNDGNASTDVFMRGPLLETPGALAFTTQPGGAAAGVAFTAQPVVEARNLDGTRKWDYTGPVTLSIKTGAGRAGALLTGTLTINAVHGIAAFTDLALNLAGAGYVLSAASGALANADSAPFAVAQTPTKLAFTVEPAGAAAGLPFTTQPVVVVKDAEDNTVAGYSNSVTLAIKPGTGRVGAALSGSATVAAVNGVATFTGLSLDKAGSGYALVASSGALAAAETSPFSVAQVATALVFSAQPAGAKAGAPFASQPTVQARDAENNVALNFSGAIAIALKPGTGPAGAALSGALTATAANGIASFTDLMLDTEGAGYVLRATSGTLTPGDSAAFSVGPGAAKLVFATDPGGATAGSPFTAQPVILVHNANDLLIPDFTGPITLAIKAGTGAAGATLDGAATVNAVGGVATFAGLSISKRGAGYVLTASSANKILGESAAFTVAPKAERLAFTKQPGSAIAGARFGVQPVVTVQDADGFTAAGYSGPVSVTLRPGSGAPGAVLSGASTINAIAGVAAFTNLSLDKDGVGFILTASSGSLPALDSAPFAVTPKPDVQIAQSSPTEIVIRALPNGITMAGASIHLTLAAGDLQPLVESDLTLAPGWTLGSLVSDANGALITATNAAGQTADGPIAAIRPRPLPGLSGRSTPIGLSADSSFTDTNANSFAVDPQTVAFIPGGHLSVTRQPGATDAGSALTGPPQASILDGSGATVADFTGPVTASIKPGTGAAGALLGGSATVNAVAGVATFGALSIDRAGSGYALTFSAGALTPADTAPFAITPKPEKLAFVLSPSGARSGVPFTTQPVVAVQDAAGNTATGFTGPVTLTIVPGSGFPGAALAGNSTVNAVGGIAAFVGLAIDKSAPGYLLEATSGALPSVNSASFSVTPFQFTLADAAKALKWSGGLTAVLPTEISVFNVDRSGSSASTVDLLDAQHIVRKAAGLEANP